MDGSGLRRGHGRENGVRESGDWSVEEVSSKSVATIAWTVGETSCVGRDKGSSTRAQVTVGSSGISSALFR